MLAIQFYDTVIKYYHHHLLILNRNPKHIYLHNHLNTLSPLTVLVISYWLFRSCLVNPTLLHLSIQPPKASSAFGLFAHLVSIPYQTHVTLLHPAHYGTPQTRCLRLVVLASLSGVPLPCVPPPKYRVSDEVVFVEMEENEL